MRYLEILFTKSKKKLSFGSKIIMWWTKQPYSHVARGLKLYDNIKMYYQANEGKVNYENQVVFDKKHEIVRNYILNVPDNIYKSISISCLNEAGKKYAFWQNIGIFLVDVCHFFGYHSMENPWKDGRNCSELIYVNVLVPIFGDLGYKPDLIKPHEIEFLICKLFELREDGIWYPITSN